MSSMDAERPRPADEASDAPTERLPTAPTGPALAGPVPSPMAWPPAEPAGPATGADPDAAAPDEPASPVPDAIVEPDATTLPLPVIPEQPPAPDPSDRERRRRRRREPHDEGRRVGVGDEAASGRQSRERPRRRGVRTIVVLAIVVVVLAVAGTAGWFAGESWAERTVVAAVRQKAAAALGLSSDSDVRVAVATPVLPQLMSGSFTRLTVTAPGVPMGGSAATVVLHAQGVPTGGGAAKSADASVRLTPAALSGLVGSLHGVDPGSLRIVGSDVAVDLDRSQFLSHVSFTLTLSPSAAAGALVLTPTAFEVAGFPMSADTVRARFGTLAPGILAPRTVCVATAFPRGMTLTGIRLAPTAATASFAVDPAIVSDPQLQAKGTCG